MSTSSLLKNVFRFYYRIGSTVTNCYDFLLNLYTKRIEELDFLDSFRSFLDNSGKAIKCAHARGLQRKVVKQSLGKDMS